MHRTLLTVLLATGLFGCSDDAVTTADTQAADTLTDTQVADTLAADTTDEDIAPDTAPDAVEVLEDVATTGWEVPSCVSISGNSGVTFTTDEVSFAPPTVAMTTGVFADGLVATDVPGTLYLSQEEVIYRSTDGGCNWSALDAPRAEYRLTPAVGGVVYAYWRDNDLLRIDGTTVTPIDVSIIILALGVDRDDPSVLLAATPDAGVIYRSTNGGAAFTKVGDGFDHFTNAARYVFDPNDVNHIIVGLTVSAVWVTFDGGETWTNASGFWPTGHVNAFDMAISPVDGDIVWANGLSVDQSEANHPSDGRHIYRSTDGGLTFEAVLDHTAAQPFTTAMPMTAHLTDPDVVYFVRNGWDEPNAELIRYDAGDDGATTITPGFARIASFAWAPSTPPTLYFGVGSY
jgi:hypothetical protein